MSPVLNTVIACSGTATAVLAPAMGPAPYLARTVLMVGIALYYLVKDDTPSPFEQEKLAEERRVFYKNLPEPEVIRIESFEDLVSLRDRLRTRSINVWSDITLGGQFGASLKPTFASAYGLLKGHAKFSGKSISNIIQLVATLITSHQNIAEIVNKMQSVYGHLSDQKFESLLEQHRYELNPAPDVVLELVVNGLFAKWSEVGDLKLVFHEAIPSLA